MRTRVTELVLVLCLGTAALQPSPVYGADADEEPGESSTADQRDANSGGDSQSASRTPSENQPDVFLPSEEISEDFAVSFPADI